MRAYPAPVRPPIPGRQRGAQARPRRTGHETVGSILLFLAGAIWSVPTGMAQTGVQEPTCMECHRPRDTTIDPVQFARSVHATLDCSTCHAEGFNKFPHTSSRAAMPYCIDCHSGSVVSPTIDFDKIAQGVQASVHVKRVDPAFRCTNCLV